MAFTEFYVTKGAGVAVENGGSMETGNGQVYDIGGADGPCATYADVDATDNGGGDHDLDNNNGGAGWGTTAVDDWICYDTAGAKEYAIVVALSVGADDDVINVLTSDAQTLTDLTSVAVNVGGAWATIDHAADTVTMDFVDSTPSPPRVNIQYDAAAYAEAVVIDNPGTSAIPITYEGYYATPGDECDNSGTWTPPEINGDTHGGTGALYSTQDYIIVRDLYVHTVDAGVEAISLGGKSWVDRCQAKATGAGSAAIKITNQGMVSRCYVEDANDIGIYLSNYASFAVGNYIYSAGDQGIYCSSSPHTVAFNVINTSVDDAIVASPSSTVFGNTIYSVSGGSGIFTTSSDRVAWFANNILSGCSVAGIESPVSMFPIMMHNAYEANTADHSTTPLYTAGEVTSLTGYPFTNEVGGVFSLNNTANEGAACRNAGFPGAMLDGTNEGFADIGALRHEDPAGGGGSTATIIGG